MWFSFSALPRRKSAGWINLTLVLIMAGLLIGCDPKYAYKHRDFNDPDDELYGAYQVESESRHWV
ncbi:MAG: hypothetical protein RLZ25_1435 [Pseudomonadota bacterium]|jgi:hypothetical protein